MSPTANVKSFDAIRDFRAALFNFADETREALTAVDGEIRRTLDWLTHDRPQYWQRQIRERSEKVAQARVDLSRARMIKSTDGYVPECIEQKQALKKAEMHLKEAEEKLDKVRHWSRAIQQAVNEYSGQSQVLTNAVDADLPRAVQVLERMLGALEAYAQMQSVSLEEPGLASAARAEESAAAGNPAAGAAGNAPEGGAAEPAATAASATSGSSTDAQAEVAAPANESPQEVGHAQG